MSINSLTNVAIQTIINNIATFAILFIRERGGNNARSKMFRKALS